MSYIKDKWNAKRYIIILSIVFIISIYNYSVYMLDIYAISYL